MDRFQGRIVHPQTWPEDLDYTGKSVVVIGSGATAATIVPAMADTRRARDDAAALADLSSAPGRNAIEIADELRTLGIDEDWIHEIVRRKILFEQARFTEPHASASRRR